MHPISAPRTAHRSAAAVAAVVAAALALLIIFAFASTDANGDDAAPQVGTSDQNNFDHQTGPMVRVNQLGYLPDGPKRATLITESPDPVSWQLLDAEGDVADEGDSSPQGMDSSAGVEVHTIDFSDHTGTGSDFTLSADGEDSYTFSITEQLYAPLRQDALNIYYTQRSGTDIEALEIDGGTEREAYERPAGHSAEFVPPWEDIDDDDAPNRGDLQVPCLPEERFTWNGTEQFAAEDQYGGPGAWQCPEDYTLDVDGGWYDAGDQGKYVVNSGISVWQMLATYERNQNADATVTDALGDKTLLIPERGNGVPDILDEARWNLEWMLSMQVPEGTRMTIDGVELDAGGMAHHKVHGIAWTDQDTLPNEDPMPRFLQRPSTAATLNLAAAAAHGVRLYEEYDPEFADELLESAEAAWEAAVEHSDIYRDTDVSNPNPGGGPYNDHEFADEFYWAAAQLYLTTGSEAYEEEVLSNEHHVGNWNDDVFDTPAFDWQNTAAAARMDLATVDSELEGRDEVISSVVEAADSYIAIQDEEPFGHPYGPEEYRWGSNHMVLNNAAVIGTAYDLTAEDRYRDAGLEAIDYILGRNAINNSYVTGYGSYYSEDMHGRWYAPDHERLPPFPDGMLAGGANSEMEDPTVEENLPGCAPQVCYIDDADSWSTNEITINWNASLVWHASWLDDMGRADTSALPETMDRAVGFLY